MAEITFDPQKLQEPVEVIPFKIELQYSTPSDLYGFTTVIVDLEPKRIGGPDKEPTDFKTLNLLKDALL